MPRLLSIEMQGFKSFANRTRITFPEGLVVIIGPNGSGKSNISDAICFVLGKRSKKEMRAEKLSHLIFNGGNSGSPAEFARVMLSIDNSKNEFPYEGKVFSLSRTIDKDGTSTYRINGKRCTMSEVENALRGANINPDGMNIIMQGEIARFVDMSPAEKRMIIEDIAGISVYEDKKRKALGELDGVGARTREGRIVLTEKKKYLDELIVEKEHAERYLKKKELLERMKGSLLLKQMRVTESKASKAESELEEENKRIEKWKLKLGESNSKIEGLRKDVELLTKEIEEGGEKEHAELGREIQAMGDRLSELKSTIRNNSDEMDRIRQRDAEIDKNIEENRSAVERMQSEKLRLEAQLGEVREKLAENGSLLEGKSKSKYFVLKEELMAVERELFLANGGLKRLEEAESSRIRVGELREDRSEKEKKSARLGELLKEAESKKKSYNDKLSEVEGYLSHLERESVRLSMAEKSVRSGNAKKVCASGTSGVHGVLQELFEVKEHENAVLSFLGQLSEAVVVSDLAAAGRVIDFARKENLGEIIILPMSEVVPAAASAPKGGIPLVECVSFDERYRKLFSAVLNGFVVKELSGGFNCVTPDGSSLNKGVVRFGRDYGDIKKLSSRVEQDTLRYSQYRSSLKDELEQANREIEDLKIKSMENRRDISEIEREMKRVGELLDGAKPGMAEEAKGKIRSLDTRKKAIEKEMAGCEVISDDLLSELNRSLSSLKNEEKETERDIISVESRIENIFARDLKSFEKIKRELEADRNRFESGSAAAAREIKILDKKLSEKQEESNRFYSKLRDRFTRREKLNRDIAEIEKSNALTEQRMEGAVKDCQELRVRRAELLAQAEGIRERLKEYGDVSEMRKDAGELEADIRLLERELSGFGPVNMKALETFREVEGEYNKLDEKVKKLEEETEGIHRMIDEIESKKNQSFVACFRRINKSFGETFESLSPGGKARLVLENEESPLEGGLDFVVRPVGKKLSSLKQLSGGEKTIVTLAFILSIQEYEAAPFYIFDEIDAALDKTNSEKLAELISGYSRSAQFIVVSHNDELVARTDYLYGVSMRPNGVSQVVSIKLKE